MGLKICSRCVNPDKSKSCKTKAKRKTARSEVHCLTIAYTTEIQTIAKTIESNLKPGQKWTERKKICAKMDISQCSNWQPSVEKYRVSKKNVKTFIITDSSLKCQLYWQCKVLLFKNIYTVVSIFIFIHGEKDKG